MRPLWKLSDLKQMHAGQTNWQEQIILDPEQDPLYNPQRPGLNSLCACTRIPRLSSS